MMIFQEQVELSFMDELTKIAAAASALAGLGAKTIFGAPLKTWGKRALMGAVPGAAIGAVTAKPGERLRGGVTGGLIGGGLGVAGGALAQREALKGVTGKKMGLDLTSRQMARLTPDQQKAVGEASTHAFPGFLQSAPPTAAV